MGGGAILLSSAFENDGCDDEYSSCDSSGELEEFVLGIYGIVGGGAFTILGIVFNAVSSKRYGHVRRFQAEKDALETGEQSLYELDFAPKVSVLQRSIGADLVLRF